MIEIREHDQYQDDDKQRAFMYGYASALEDVRNALESMASELFIGGEDEKAREVREMSRDVGNDANVCMEAWRTRNRESDSKTSQE